MAPERIGFGLNLWLRKASDSVSNYSALGADGADAAAAPPGRLGVATAGLAAFWKFFIKFSATNPHSIRNRASRFL